MPYSINIYSVHLFCLVAIEQMNQARYVLAANSPEPRKPSKRGVVIILWSIYHVS